MQRKQEFKSKSKSKLKASLPEKTVTTTTTTTTTTDIPFLQASNLQGRESPKDLWRLFNMIGPIRHLEVYQKSNSTEFVNEHNCIVQYESRIV